MEWYRTLGDLTAAVVFVVLVVSGSLKLVFPRATADALQGYGILGHRSSAWARALGGLELAAGVATVWLPARWLALIVAALLFSSMAVVVGRALRLGLTVGCGCGGRHDDPLEPLHFVRLVLLIMACVLAIRFAPDRPHLDATFVQSLCASAGIVGVWLIVQRMVSSHRSHIDVVEDVIDWNWV